VSISPISFPRWRVPCCNFFDPYFVSTSFRIGPLTLIQVSAPLPLLFSPSLLASIRGRPFLFFWWGSCHLPFPPLRVKTCTIDAILFSSSVPFPFSFHGPKIFSSPLNLPGLFLPPSLLFRSCDVENRSRLTLSFYQRPQVPFVHFF